MHASRQNVLIQAYITYVRYINNVKYRKSWDDDGDLTLIIIASENSFLAS